jgi:mRNA-degrading endonuclease toxin of MazEF toxin-antitoxin module
MIKNYFLALLDWCKVTVVLWDKESAIAFKEGEVWWCAIGLNVGEEVYGKGTSFARPVLVFRKLTRNSFLGLPLTGSEKKGSWYVPLELPSRKSSIMLNQAKVIDKKRLRDKIVTVNVSDFRLIKKLFHELYCS